MMGVMSVSCIDHVHNELSLVDALAILFLFPATILSLSDAPS